MNNTTISVTDFLLHCEVNADQTSMITIFLTLVYILSVCGNLLVIFVIVSNPKLHAPMYMYIGTLAVIDMCNSTILIPKMLSLLISNATDVPYGACLLQMYVILNMEEMESLLLAFMAIDRYAAVVHPLRYNTIFTNKTIWIIILLLNIFAIFFNSPFLFFANELSFCRSNILPYCFCDYATMVHVACTENPKYLFLLSIVVIITGVFPLLLILFSYGRIALAALKITSADGRKKVISTCLTHLLVVGLFYIPLLSSYILPGAGVPMSTEVYNAMVIVGNVFPPMMNPIIYSFRNKEINTSIINLFGKKRTIPEINNH
ncbi:olfactory receptor 1496-like [Erpetoichthys calabaricus]|uniref:olfactory receptor 1496-like n=1 Tax=Erpetoichthys calabaricus TaxID=27687 RepID=UPI0022341424|nr:olfactory receptor 1496-like [Erpetoichthys calabaricus]